MGIHHLAHMLTVPPTKACILCATPAGMDLYIQVHAQRLLPSAAPWISEDSLLKMCLFGVGCAVFSALSVWKNVGITNTEVGTGQFLEECWHDKY